MKKILLGMVFVGLSGCASTGMGLSTGFAIVNIHKEAGSATNAAGASKTGKACANNYLGIAAVGDNSIEAAKKNGGISTVASVDYDITNILGFYGASCVIVKGN
jgi:hypothetical protein